MSHIEAIRHGEMDHGIPSTYSSVTLCNVDLITPRKSTFVSGFSARNEGLGQNAGHLIMQPPISLATRHTLQM